MTKQADVKFHCYRCDKLYTDSDRKLEPYCECGARRLKVSFGKIPPGVPSEIKDYLQMIFQEAENVFGRTRDELVYEKGFILLALLKFICGGPQTRGFGPFYASHRKDIVQTYRTIIKEFKAKGFRVPSSAMPGMAEEEMLGTRPNRLKITMSKYENVRFRLMNLTAQECRNSIMSVETQLKNRLYEQSDDSSTWSRKARA